MNIIQLSSKALWFLNIYQLSIKIPINIVKQNIFKTRLNKFLQLPYLNNFSLRIIKTVQVNIHKISTPVINPLQKLINQAILQLNRNGRIPKRANHGARPCSSVLRRARKKQYYRRWNQKTPADLQQITSKK